MRCEQARTCAPQGHVLDTVRPSAWLVFDETGFTDGSTTLAGKRGSDQQRNPRWGVTLALPVTRHHSVKLAANTALVMRGTGEFPTVSAIWRYRWGAGL